MSTLCALATDVRVPSAVRAVQPADARSVLTSCRTAASSALRPDVPGGAVGVGSGPGTGARVEVGGAGAGALPPPASASGPWSSRLGDPVPTLLRASRTT